MTANANEINDSIKGMGRWLMKYGARFAVLDSDKKDSNSQNDISNIELYTTVLNPMQLACGPEKGLGQASMKPGFGDMVGRAKWDAWNSLGSLSQVTIPIISVT